METIETNSKYKNCRES